MTTWIWNGIVSSITHNLSLNMGVDDNPLYNDFACLEDQKAKCQKEGNVACLRWFTYYRITKDEMWYICLTKFAFTIVQPSYFQISTFITNDSPAFLCSQITLKVSTISSLLSLFSAFSSDSFSSMSSSSESSLLETPSIYLLYHLLQGEPN